MRSDKMPALPFFTSNPDILKEFNDELSKKIIAEMNSAYSLLSAGRVEEYVDAVNDVIAENFTTKTKVTLKDILRDENLVESLKEDLNCNVTKISEIFASNQNAVPVFNVVFPKINSDPNCFSIPPSPTIPSIGDHPQISYIAKFNQLFANAVAGKPSSKFQECAIGNPPEINNSWNISFNKDNFKCAIPPFIQNYFLASDSLSEAGGEKHFIFASPSAHSHTPPSFLHYVGAKSSRGEGLLAFVNSNEMVFTNPISLSPYTILHETLHWLGMDHPDEVPVVSNFLGEWAIKTGDPLPSVSTYPYNAVGDRKSWGRELLKHEIISSEDAVLFHEDFLASDTNHHYLRPYDVLTLKALQHRRLICMPQRQEAGYVTNIGDDQKSTGQQCAAQHMTELQNHNFSTLSNSSQKILTHSLKRLAGIEVPIILAEGLLTACKSDDPEQCSLRKMITSENGINNIKAAIRTLSSLVTMGCNATAASLIVQGAIPLSLDTCKIISYATGFSDSEISERISQTSEYISKHVPEVVRDNLFGVAMLYAIHNIQYSDYVDGYIHNLDKDLNFIPRNSISFAEAAITSCLVAVISSALSSGIKNQINKSKKSQKEDSPTTTLESPKGSSLSRQRSDIHEKQS